MIWRIPPLWDGETCAILAGGPSLAGFDIAPLHPLRVITINDSWRLEPEADIHYFCDLVWWEQQWRMNRKSLDGSIDFHTLADSGFWVKGEENRAGGKLANDPRVRVVLFSGQRGLDPDPARLRHGSNSGYQAIHLAYHLGVKRILLLGYDMKLDARHRSHWHAEERPRNFEHIITHSFVPNFPAIVEPLAAAGVEVINCTPGSALDCWPSMSLDEALAQELKGV